MTALFTTMRPGEDFDESIDPFSADLKVTITTERSTENGCFAPRSWLCEVRINGEFFLSTRSDSARSAVVSALSWAERHVERDRPDEGTIAEKMAVVAALKDFLCPEITAPFSDEALGIPATTTARMEIEQTEADRRALTQEEYEEQLRDELRAVDLEAANPGLPRLRRRRASGNDQTGEEA